MFDAKPYSAHSWLAAWHYAPKLCWEDMLNEFEQDVEAALRCSHDVDATLTHIYQELRKVNMPTDPVFLETFYKYCGNDIQAAKQGNPKPCAESMKRKIDHMVSWLIDIARKQPA
ncbi:hypothetical protein IQ273_07710 [Nodosilinea sp. LEGE 07298]|uniref:hypothetical protein n=1 Tax=Nodosilinea sp. LEGE 07298 TaxID=2777970 RepID=UPI0018811FC4|nr:hypothetical protein [Nodosilinea sp. LEGE 07298]MBE9109299.1 hypothetical protein [Nodosilinea sp. LEGE 07298]